MISMIEEHVIDLVRQSVPELDTLERGIRAAGEKQRRLIVYIEYDMIDRKYRSLQEWRASGPREGYIPLSAMSPPPRSIHVRPRPMPEE
jgi:hypothetical protein